MDVRKEKDSLNSGVKAGEGKEPSVFKKLAQNKTWTAFWSNLLFIAVWFVIFYVLFYVFPPYIVSGESMNETLSDKAFGFGFRYGELERGDIVVFSNEETKGEAYIKRVIAVPGDTIRLEGYSIYLNGELLTEDYAYIDPAFTGTRGSYVNTEKLPWLSLAACQNADGDTEFAYCGEYTLGEDEYFVMGDNRCHSNDSRSIGTISRKDVKCKMLFFLWGKKR